MKNIFLIDDDMDDIELFRDALPDLIFLDISMPTLSGLQCLASFKKDEQLKNLPVIMYTTSSQEREIRTAQELGASGFVTKPNDFKVLKRMLTMILQTPGDQLAEVLRRLPR
jgi:CheY-like chemotaxis protein